MVSALRINEIMYNPAGDDYDFEYIELYSDEEIDLSNYYFEGIDFVFPENTIIQDYLIVANTCNDSGEMNDFTDKYDMECYYEYKDTLSNNGEEIVLFSPDGGTAAQVDYSLELTSNGLIVSEIEGGTPGYENTHPYDFDETINETINETIDINISNSTNISTNSTINQTSINETNTTDVNGTLDLTENNSINFCNPSIEIQTSKINFSKSLM